MTPLTNVGPRASLHNYTLSLHRPRP